MNTETSRKGHGRTLLLVAGALLLGVFWAGPLVAPAQAAPAPGAAGSHTQRPAADRVSRKMKLGSSMTSIRDGAEDPTCSSTQSISFGGAPIDASIVDPSEAACFTFNDSSPDDTVLVNLDPTSSSSTPDASVSNGSATVACYVARSSNCQLTSAGAWTLEVTAAVAESFVVSVQSVAEPVGCSNIAYGPTVIAGGISSPTESDCYVFTSPIDWISVFVALQSGDLAPQVQLFGPGGESGGTCASTVGNGGGGFNIQNPGTWLLVVESCSESQTGTFDLQVENLGVSSPSGSSHQRVQLIGEGFQAGEKVTFTYETGEVGFPSARVCSAVAVGSDGQASCHGDVPAEPAAGAQGEHLIEGVGESSGVTVSGTYDLTLSPFSCAKASGIASVITLKKCTPLSSYDKTGTTTLTMLTSGGQLTWAPSGQTTVFTATSSSPGFCKKGWTEVEITGSVTGGTASSTAIGDPVSLSLCESTGGSIKLLPGTRASF